MGKSIIEKQLELLEETVAYYSKHPRCVGVNLNNLLVCKYDSRSLNIKGTTGCAIGRKCKPALRKKLDELRESLEELFDRLPILLNELGYGYLFQLQILHDTNEYWNNQVLTEEGIEYVNDFKNEINQGLFSK